MDLFNDMKKERAQRFKKDTTIVKIQEYQLHQDPKLCKIIGLDMLNKDGNGNPKKVEVQFNDPSGKSMGIQEYADPGAMMHTEVGGMVRLDRFITRGDGTYVTGHMQRIAQSEKNRVSKKQEEFSVGIMKAWTKILPERDANGNIAEIQRSNNSFISRGKALVIPEDAKPETIVFGTPEFRTKLSAMVETAVNNAPDRAKPIILMRSEGPDNQAEAILQTVKKNPDNTYSEMVKEEILEAARNNTELQMWLAKNDQATQAGVEMPVEFLPGMQLDMVGLVTDPRSGDRLDKPKVQFMAHEATRWFPLPKEEGKEQEHRAASKPEYKLSVISYEINLTNGQRQTTLSNLGVIPGVTASPDAGLSKTPNPFWPETATAAPAAKAAQAAPAAQPDQAQAAPAQETPAAPASLEEDQPGDGETDFNSLNAMDDLNMGDFDEAELEEALATQGL